MAKVLFTLGTRPELIKLAPVILEMYARGWHEHLLVVNTGQHRELMQDTAGLMGIKADYTLDLMVPGQSLNELVGRALLRLQQLLSLPLVKAGQPTLVVGQGDTATAFAAALTAFHNRIPFAHVEAGLRTNDLCNPFPEEYYRKLITAGTTVHFTPTLSAGFNLLREGVDASRVRLTGNTVVDALGHIQKMACRNSESLPSSLTELMRGNKNIVLVTCHRRENFGKNIQQIISTVKSIAKRYPGFHFVWIMHPNPSAKAAVQQSGMERQHNMYLVNPLGYFELIRLYPHVKIIITDSGGMQEEAPSFGIPVIVMRETTERMESVENGYAFLCGADPGKITEAFDRCAEGKIKITHNPYGDGKAARRIADHIGSMLRLGQRMNLTGS